MRTLVMLLAVALCAASATSKSYETKTVKAADVSDDDLFSGALRVLVDEGFTFREKDRDARVIATDWRPAKLGLTANVSQAWHVVVADHTIRLGIDCQQVVHNDFSGADSTEDCGSARDEDWVNTDSMLGRMREEARQIARDRARGAAPTSAPASQP